jgi:polysaccharide export outer membrane protein
MIKKLLLSLAAVFVATTAFAQSGYTIKPGDQLTVEVLEDSTLNRQVLVLPDGSVSFPLAGTVTARGQTTAGLAQTIASQIAPNFASQPNVYVSVAELATPTSSGTSVSRTISIFVLGEVGTTGEVEVDPGTTLLQALSQAGGLTKFAATKRIQLRRTDPQTGTDVVFPFNYRAVQDGAKISGNTILSDGDVILVPQRRLFE